MAELYKKQSVRYSTPEGRRCSPDTPGGIRRVELSRKWYGTVRGKSVPLCADKQKALQLLRKRLADAELARHGLADPYADSKKCTLADHLHDFAGSLRAKGDGPRHVALTVSRINAVLDGTQVVWLADLDSGRVADLLIDLRADRQGIELPDGQDWFKLSEVAELLDVKPGSVSKAVQRNRLEATGAGKARRFPKATVHALAERMSKGLSSETSNHHVRALRSFGRWLARTRRWPSNPFDNLALLNTSMDRRHDRRELCADELCQLLVATRNSPRSFRGLAALDRWALYLAACGTGFRVRALAGLAPDDFDLTAEVPIVVLPARLAKNKKIKVQPLPRDVADALCDYLSGKPTDRPVWTGGWKDDAAEMIRADLADAGIPYSVEGPDGPLYADFHALRHSYITMLGRSGVDLRTAQELAGHSTPNLTARYSHRQLHDLTNAVEKLPKLFMDGNRGKERVELKATGSEGVDGCSMVAQTLGNHQHPEASSGTDKGLNEQGAASPQPLALSSDGTLCHHQSSVKALGLEPRTYGLKVRCSTN